MIENFVNSFFSKCNLFCATLLMTFLVIIEQIPPFSFFSPLLISLVLFFYYLLLNELFFYSIFLVFFFSLISFFADLFYFNFVNMKIYTSLLNKLNLKIDLSNFRFKKRFFMAFRLSPLYKALIYENFRDELLKKEKLLFYFYLSHFFFYSILFLIGLIMFLSKKVFNLKYLDLGILVLTFFLLKKIVKFEVNIK